MNSNGNDNLIELFASEDELDYDEDEKKEEKISKSDSIEQSSPPKNIVQDEIEVISKIDSIEQSSSINIDQDQNEQDPDNDPKAIFMSRFGATLKNIPIKNVFSPKNQLSSPLLIIGDVWIDFLKEKWHSTEISPEVYCIPNISCKLATNLISDIKKSAEWKNLLIICSFGLNDILSAALNENFPVQKIVKEIITSMKTLQDTVKRELPNAQLLFTDIPFISVKKIIDLESQNSQLWSDFDAINTTDLSSKVLKAISFFNNILHSRGLSRHGDLNDWHVFSNEMLRNYVFKTPEKELDLNHFEGLLFSENTISSVMENLKLIWPNYLQYCSETNKDIINIAYLSSCSYDSIKNNFPHEFLDAKPQFLHIQNFDGNHLVSEVSKYCSNYYSWLFVIELNIRDFDITMPSTTCQDFAFHEPLQIICPDFEFNPNFMDFAIERLLKLETVLKNKYQSCKVTFVPFPSVDLLSFQRNFIRIHNKGMHKVHKLPFPIDKYTFSTSSINSQIENLNSFIDKHSQEFLLWKVWDKLSSPGETDCLFLREPMSELSINLVTHNIIFLSINTLSKLSKDKLQKNRLKQKELEFIKRKETKAVPIIEVPPVRILDSAEVAKRNSQLKKISEKSREIIPNRTKYPSPRRRRERSRSRGKSGSYSRRSRSRSHSRRRYRSRSRKSRSCSRRKSRSRSRRRFRSRSRRRSRSHLRRSRSCSRRKSRSRSRRRFRCHSRRRSRSHSWSSGSSRSRRYSRSSSKSPNPLNEKKRIKKDLTRHIIAKIWQKHQEEIEKYRLAPNSHPDYERERSEFMKTISQSMFFISPKPTALQIMIKWTDYWKERMEIILDVSWKAKKKEALKLFKLETRSESRSPPNMRTPRRSQPGDINISSREENPKGTIIDLTYSPHPFPKSTTEKLFACDEPLEQRKNIVSEEASFTGEGLSDTLKRIIEEQDPFESSDIDLISLLNNLSKLSLHLGTLGVYITLMHGKALEVKGSGLDPMSILDEQALKLLFDVKVSLQDSLSRSRIPTGEETTARCIKELSQLLKAKKPKDSIVNKLNIEAVVKKTFGMTSWGINEYIISNLRKHGHFNVSLDSITDLQQLIMAEHLQMKGDPGPSSSKSSTVPFSPVYQSAKDEQAPSTSASAQVSNIRYSIEEIVIKCGKFSQLRTYEKQLVLKQVAETDKHDPALATSLKILLRKSS